VREVRPTARLAGDPYGRSSPRCISATNLSLRHVDDPT
jgi:hypothetical protein